MKLSDKIWEGRYRECYSVEWTDLCAKRSKAASNSFRRIVRGLLDGNPNEAEFKAYETLPGSLRAYVPDTVSLEGELLVMTKACDFDGNPSKSILEAWKVDDAGFWREVDRIVEILDSEGLYFFDVFHHGNNVLVKKLSESESFPMIVDFKRIGWKSYPFQPNLAFESQRRKKFFRRLERFERKFRPEGL